MKPSRTESDKNTIKRRATLRYPKEGIQIPKPLSKHTELVVKAKSPVSEKSTPTY